MFYTKIHLTQDNLQIYLKFRYLHTVRLTHIVYIVRQPLTTSSITTLMPTSQINNTHQ